MALGLGTHVVNGWMSLLFSPGNPGLLPQLDPPQEYVKRSQTSFLAIDLEKISQKYSCPPASSLCRLSLEDAEKHGSLQFFGSIYDGASDRYHTHFDKQGPRVLTFERLLRHSEIPLAEALDIMLKRGSEHYGCNVELEFAMNLKEPGQASAQLAILQMRPSMSRNYDEQISCSDYLREQLIGRTSNIMGHGKYTRINDVLLVEVKRLNSLTASKIRRELEQLNNALEKNRRPYLLLGPGRWGSMDSHLGVPVTWEQISGAKVIAELPVGGRLIAPSQGTHLFHNMVTMDIGYLGFSDTSGGFDSEFIDIGWLKRQHIEQKKEFVFHLQLDKPISIVIDGRRKQGIIKKD